MNNQAERWTFLTSHARVLLTIARDPAARLRDIAAACRITERTALAIVTDLEQADYLHRERLGRRNQYTLHLDGSFRHPAEAGLPVRALVELFTGREEGAALPPPRKSLPPQGGLTRSSLGERSITVSGGSALRFFPSAPDRPVHPGKVAPGAGPVVSASCEPPWVAAALRLE